MKEIETKHLKVALIVSIMLLAIACGYILTEEVDFCSQARNESLAIGFNQGVQFWNSQVVYGVNTNNEIPYIINNSIQAVPIKTFCEEGK